MSAPSPEDIAKLPEGYFSIKMGKWGPYATNREQANATFLNGCGLVFEHTPEEDTILVLNNRIFIVYDVDEIRNAVHLVDSKTRKASSYLYKVWRSWHE